VLEQPQVQGGWRERERGQAHWGRGWGSVLAGKAHTHTLIFHSTPYFYEGYFCRVPPACALGEGVSVYAQAELAL